MKPQIENVGLEIEFGKCLWDGQPGAVGLQENSLGGSH